MAITAEMVKELREQTGAAVLDCKKALEEFKGDMEKAKAYLAEKGLATAQKKADREAREGKVETYTHTGGRVGVMVEVNCETDFVANTSQFQAFAHDVALHIAFANPRYVDVADVPESMINVQKEALNKEATARGKAGADLDDFVSIEMEKYLTEMCLLRQPFVKDESVTIGNLVTKTIAEVKENIRISRFARFELGGGNGTEGGGGEE